MAVFSDNDLLHVLRKCYNAGEYGVLFRSYCYEASLEGDFTKPHYLEWKESHIAAVKSGIEKGFLNERVEKPTFREYVQEPDICNHFATISGSGLDRLNELERPWLLKLQTLLGRWLERVVNSIVLPIVASILTVIALSYFGLGTVGK